VKKQEKSEKEMKKRKRGGLTPHDERTLPEEADFPCLNPNSAKI
jgi:hypothetical protein